MTEYRYIEMEGFTINNYDVSIQSSAVKMVQAVMDTEQDNVLALEEIFEQAVLEARDLLRSVIYEETD